FRSMTPDANTTRNYPWIALFQGRLARAATFTSVLILPIFADGLLVYRYGQRGEMSTRIGAAATILMALAGTWVMSQVNAIRRDVTRLEMGNTEATKVPSGLGVTIANGSNGMGDE